MGRNHGRRPTKRAYTGALAGPTWQSSHGNARAKPYDRHIPGLRLGVLRHQIRALLEARCIPQDPSSRGIGAPRNMSQSPHPLEGHTKKETKHPKTQKPKSARTFRADPARGDGKGCPMLPDRQIVGPNPTDACRRQSTLIPENDARTARS